MGWRGRLTSSAAGPRRRWAGHRCRRSSDAASSRAAPRRSTLPAGPEWRSAARSARAQRPKKIKTKKTHTQESIASVTSNVLLWRLKLLRKKRFIRSKWLYCYSPVTSKGLYVSRVSRHLTLGFQLKAHPPDCHLLLLQVLHRHAVHFILCGGRRKKNAHN